MKNVITLGTLWYNVVQTAPKKFEEVATAIPQALDGGSRLPKA